MTYQQKSRWFLLSFLVMKLHIDGLYSHFHERFLTPSMTEGHKSLPASFPLWAHRFSCLATRLPQFYRPWLLYFELPPASPQSGSPFFLQLYFWFIFNMSKSDRLPQAHSLVSTYIQWSLQFQYLCTCYDSVLFP